MKYLSDYMNDKQSALFDQYGVFFAFSQEQFLAARKEGVKYVDVPLIVGVKPNEVVPYENIPSVSLSINI